MTDYTDTDVRALLDEVHYRSARAAQQAGPLAGFDGEHESPLATDPADERVVASWLAEGLARVARRARRRTLAALATEAAAGARSIELPAAAGRVFWASVEDTAGTRPLALCAPEALLGQAAATAGPTRATLVTGPTLYLDAPLERAATVVALAENLSPLDLGQAHGGYRMASPANDAPSIAPVPIEFRRAAVAYVLWQHFLGVAAARAGTPPGTTGAALADHYARAFGEAVVEAMDDPAAPPVTSRPYRAF